MTAREKVRLDQLLVTRGLASSRNVARGLIMAGLVSVDGRPVDKPGAPVHVDASLDLKERPRFVSRAGEKLAHALDIFRIDVAGRHALDVGASTGGFVDCLLQAGASQVIALDVGYGQLDARLREDLRVHVVDRVNARYLTPSQLPYRADLLTVDVSFISLTKVLPAAVACLQTRFDALLLVKPQFEAGPADVGKGGIVRDPAVHRRVLLIVIDHLVRALGLSVQGVTSSGLPGAGGNLEFVVWAQGGSDEGLSLATLERQVDALVDRTGG